MRLILEILWYTALISLVRHWYLDGMGIKIKLFSYNNKANVRDLLAATSLVILLNLDSNHRFFHFSARVTLKFDG